MKRGRQREEGERDSQLAPEIKVKTETLKIEPTLDSLLSRFTV